MQARSLVMRDFHAEPLDQTAKSRDTKRIDPVNGQTAALIKITTPLRLDELEFTGSALGVVDAVQKTGQIWLYVPERSQRINIIHKEHGEIKVEYSDEIVSGGTYSMTLTFEGKDVSFVASASGADISVDGVSVGVTPQTLYLSYGVHEVRAQKGSLLYDGNVNITQNGPNVYELKMEDENLKFADITVTVPDAAEIWYEGERVGVGSWKARLREGQHIVETRKANCESRTTAFTVQGAHDATIRANAPEPHRGWLRLTLFPETGVNIMAGDTIFTRNTNVQLPVGAYELTFTRGGYNPQTKVYRIAHLEEISDTITLQRKQYVRTNGGFVGAGFSYGTIPGVSAFIGGTYRNIMLEGSFTYGITKSKDVAWFAVANDLYDETVNYSMNEFAVKLGYQFRFIERLGLTPQLGYMCQMLKSHAVTGADGQAGAGIRGDKAYCGNMTIGARFCYMPMQHMSLFVTPEYAIPVSKTADYDRIAPIAGISKGGFYAHVGLTFNF